MTSAPPEIVLYTSHVCPYAHRAHIALKESGLEYKEVIIDLNKPREAWYLEVNPRGLVPTISYNGKLIIESGIIAQFIADAHPSHLLPVSSPSPSASGGVENALYRARVNLFVDAFSSKVLPYLSAGIRADSKEERDGAAEGLVGAILKEVEPLLYVSGEGDGKGPFFGGSEKLTFVEVLTGSFLLRLLSFSKPEYGLLSPKLPALLNQAPKFKRWAEATVQHPSVNFIWDEKVVAERTKAKFGGKA